MSGDGDVRTRGIDLELLDDSEFVAALHLGAVTLGRGTDAVGSTSTLRNTYCGAGVVSPGELEIGGDCGHLRFHSIRIGKVPKV